MGGLRSHFIEPSGPNDPTNIFHIYMYYLS